MDGEIAATQARRNAHIGMKGGRGQGLLAAATALAGTGQPMQSRAAASDDGAAASSSGPNKWARATVSGMDRENDSTMLSPG